MSRPGRDHHRRRARNANDEETRQGDGDHSSSQPSLGSYPCARRWRRNSQQVLAELIECSLHLRRLQQRVGKGIRTSKYIVKIVWKRHSQQSSTFFTPLSQ